MNTLRLPLLELPLKAQRYSCHGCGHCCRDFTVQLRDGDVERLREQRWEERLGEAVVVEFRGQRFLRQRDDGACVFWMPDGRCRIHAEFGFEEKPVACQLFPFSLVPEEGGVQVGVNFACGSVAANRGAALASHRGELMRIGSFIPELAGPVAVRLDDRLQASAREVAAVRQRIDPWLARPQPISTMLDGLAFLAESLLAARLEKVRGARFEELLGILVEALPAELPLQVPPPPSPRQWRMLRQAVAARLEDPRLGSMARRGRWRTVLGQLGRSWRFSRGRGRVPVVVPGWPTEATFDAVRSVVLPSEAAAVEAIGDLLRRWLRATLLGGRAWGAGHYGWPISAGVAAMSLNASAVLWVARLHAVLHGRGSLSIDDLVAAVGRIDRAAGRAPWLGSAGERLRLGYLAGDRGLRRLAMALA